MLTKVTFRATFIALCTMLSAGAYAIADAPRRVDIPAGELSVALLKLSNQYGADLVYRPEQVYGLKTQGAHGSLTTEQAVTQLLQGTVLELRTDQSGAMLIAPPASGSAHATGNAPQASAAPSQEASDASKEGKKSSSGEFRVAQVDQANARSTALGNSSQSSAGQSGGPALTEIIVTAQKREQRLQDVPVPVSAITGEALVQSNQLRLQDFYSSLPNLTVAPGDQSSQFLSIRGITTGTGNPTVGIVIDDVPYGSSTQLGGSALVPDIDPNDLARIEVLRGPQGTLYGASSMGGLLKFVTVDPSTDAVSGRVEAGTSSVHNGNELGYEVRGSVNVPINDSLAVRASGFDREDPGYIDNPILGLDGLNQARVYGTRLSALWKPSDVLSLKLSALYQESKGNGSSDINIDPSTGQPKYGDLNQNYLPGTGGYERTVQAYSAIVSARLGIVDLTSLSGYNINHYSDAFDFSSAFGPGQVLYDANTTRKFSQEIRLRAPVGEWLDWTVGGFYTHEDSPYVQIVGAVSPTTGASQGLELTQSAPTTFAEYAAFANLTVHATDRFDIQLGARESDIKQTFTQIQSGVLVGPTPVVIPDIDTSNNAFTYLLTPEFKISRDLMVYARLASGYRAGGPNTSTVGSTSLPTQYNPDKTENYELGVKGDVLDHVLLVDLSLYHIDWKDIQVSVSNSRGSTYDVNGNGAKSQGIELSTQAHPLSGLTIATWLVWNEAVLKQPFPANSSVVTEAGDRLPYSSKFSGDISIDQQFPLSAALTGDFGAAVSYIGNREGLFLPTGFQRQFFPAYAKADLHAGATLGSWGANLFVNNIADRRGVINGDLRFPPHVLFIQPRTVGISVSKHF